MTISLQRRQSEWSLKKWLYIAPRQITSAFLRLFWACCLECLNSAPDDYMLAILQTHH